MILNKIKFSICEYSSQCILLQIHYYKPLAAMYIKKFDFPIMYINIFWYKNKWIPKYCFTNV